MDARLLVEEMIVDHVGSTTRPAVDKNREVRVWESGIKMND